MSVVGQSRVTELPTAYFYEPIFLNFTKRKRISMPILEVANKRILYLHVPKTGGSSIEHMLKKLGRLTLIQEHASPKFPCVAQHWHGEILHELFGDGAEFAAVFMTTRHPFTRLESEYRYRIANYSRPKFLVPSFERWTINAIKSYQKNPYAYGNHIRPQVEFEIFRPRVFKLEEGLDKISAYLSQVLSLSEPLRVDMLNASPSTRQLKWSSHLEQRVREFYKRDFIRFGYE